MRTPSGSYAVPRRTALKLVGGGLLAGTVATTPASARRDALARELETVRNATRCYRDLDRALDDGYELGSPYVPQMGFHFVNAELIAADEEAGPVDGIENPPVLVYVTTRNYRPEPGAAHEPEHDAALRLAAVEFAHAGAQQGAPGDYFSDEASSRQLKTTEEEGWGPIPDTPLTALHVWVHRHNPAGVFHPTNPIID